jgi:hypothetical protein
MEARGGVEGTQYVEVFLSVPYQCLYEHLGFVSFDLKKESPEYDRCQPRENGTALTWCGRPLPQLVLGSSWRGWARVAIPFATATQVR